MSDQAPPGASAPNNDAAVVAGNAGTPMTLAGKYYVVRVIGEGSFGRVYLATDPRVRRNVAVKELLASRQTDRDAYARALERFQREARAAGVTQHPNIVTVYELAVDGADNYYLVMEYIDGTDLRALLTQVGTLPPERAISITLDIARALEEIHAQDIVHRDLKPANIMLTRRGVAKLTDFGVAQVGSESQRTTVTTGHPGTPMYMSPEQSHSTGYLDGRSDLYSLGLVMYEMLAGTPFARTRRPLEAVRTDIPASIVAVVNRLLQANPDDRYADASELVAALEALSTRPNSHEMLPLPPGINEAETRAAAPEAHRAAGGGLPSAPPLSGAPPFGSPPYSYGNNTQPFGAYPPPGYSNAASFPPPNASSYPPPQPAPPKRGIGPLIAIGAALIVVLTIVGVVAAKGRTDDTTTTATPGSTSVALINTTAMSATGASPAASIAVPATTPAPINTVAPMSTPVPPTPAPPTSAVVSPAPLQPTPRPVSATPNVALTTWSDPDGRLKLQFPSSWTISRGTDDADNILRLDGPDGVRLNLYQYTASSSLVQDFQDLRDQDLMCANAKSMCGAVMDTKVGTEAAKYAEGSFSVANGDPTTYAYWLVDHLGVRYEFELLNVGKHKAEGQALINSVIFLNPTKPTTTVPPKPTTGALAVWTDASGTIKLQHPSEWKESLDTTNSDNVLKLSGDGATIYVNIAAPSGSLDDEIAYFRKTHGDANKQFTYTYDAPIATKVGGETAKAISYSYVITNDPKDKPSTGTYWVVDHKGKRYVFQCSDLVLHRTEIEAMMSSVTFRK